MSEQAVMERINYVEMNRELYSGFNALTPPITNTVWEAINWREEERYSRAIFLYLNCQEVWITTLSDGLREWLVDEAQQAKFRGDCRRTEAQRVARAVNKPSVLGLVASSRAECRAMHM